MNITIGNYNYQRPAFSFISTSDFDIAKEECKKILINCATSKRKPIAYKALALALISIDYPFDDDPLMHALACMVGELSIEEFLQNRALISAMVVNKEHGTPGRGFFTLARDLGLTIVDEDVFWGNEMNKIYSQNY
jgi:hypothetical protein